MPIKLANKIALVLGLSKIVSEIRKQVQGLEDTTTDRKITIHLDRNFLSQQIA